MQGHLKQEGYFPHVDGLRAVAVLAVIFYHLNPGWLPGGFTGVDVFFVISGFVITALILFVADSFPDEVREEKQEP